MSCSFELLKDFMKFFIYSKDYISINFMARKLVSYMTSIYNEQIFLSRFSSSIKPKPGTVSNE